MVNGYVQNMQQPRLEVLFEIAKISEVDPKELIALLGYPARPANTIDHEYKVFDLV